MNLVSTATPPTEITIGSMIDIPELPGEYAVVIDAQQGASHETVLVVSHAGELHSLIPHHDALIPVVSYAFESNALDASR